MVETVEQKQKKQAKKGLSREVWKQNLPHILGRGYENRMTIRTIYEKLGMQYYGNPPALRQAVLDLMKEGVYICVKDTRDGGIWLDPTKEELIEYYESLENKRCGLLVRMNALDNLIRRYNEEKL